jgi:hypothetical protein
MEKDGIKERKLNYKFGYYTTSKQINTEPICAKYFIHRCIDYDELFNLEVVDTSKNYNVFKKLYSNFIYPDKFKEYKISQNIEKVQIYEIISKMKSYQEKHFDIYVNINGDMIRNINESNAFIKFVITNNNNIEAFIVFYKLDILNKKQNKNARTLYLHYYFVNENDNIIDYLEFVGEFMKNNNICDMFITNLFDENIPPRYFMGSGVLFYNLWNVKPFKIKEQRLQMIII